MREPHLSLTELTTEELIARMMSSEKRVLPQLGVTEHRSLPADRFELRAGDQNTLTLKGYAAVFDTPYPVGGFTEIVDRRAFDQTLKQNPDVQLLINHGGEPLARTARAGKPGTMTLSADSKGLLVEARLDRGDADVARIEPKMRRGDMDEMSFAFRTVRQEWNDDDSLRRLLEVNIHKGDVSVVNYGANDATSAQIRSAVETLELLGTVDADAVLAEMRGLANPAAALEHAQRSLGSLLRTVRDNPPFTVADAEQIIAAPRD